MTIEWEPLSSLVVLVIQRDLEVSEVPHRRSSNCRDKVYH